MFFGPLAVLALFLSVFVSDAHPASDPSAAKYRKAADYYNQLIKSPKEFPRSKWKEAVALFKKVYVDHPKGRRTSDALYMSGKVYQFMYGKFKQSADRENAITIFRVLSQGHGDSSLADDALYRTGEIYMWDGNYEKAEDAYSGVLKWFPKGDMAGKARERMKEIRGKRKSRPKIETARKDDLSEFRGIRMWSSDEYARVVFDVSDIVNYRVTHLTTKGLLIVDLTGTKMDRKNSGDIRKDAGIVSDVKIKSLVNSSHRVEISLNGDAAFSTMELSGPPRIVVDITRKKDESSTLVARRGGDSSALLKRKKAVAEPAVDPALVEAGLVASPSGGGEYGKPEVEEVSFAPAPDFNVRTIVLDPGHGGKDPGAVGGSGLKEKDVVLDIAKRLRSVLAKECGCRIVLTREDDRFIPLEERTAIANTLNADLFVSIHVNSSPKGRAEGVETYFLSPAKSKAELYTQARENMIAAKDEGEDMGDLAFILTDMKNTDKINESSRMASSIQDSIISGMRPHYKVRDHGVKKAMFYVLHGARMPSVLVETSFISNRNEERRLRSGVYRQKIAEGIAGGINGYIAETRTAMMSR